MRKSHTDDMSLPRSGLVENFASSNQRHKPDLGSAVS